MHARRAAMLTLAASAAAAATVAGALPAAAAPTPAASPAPAAAQPQPPSPTVASERVHVVFLLDNSRHTARAALRTLIQTPTSHSTTAIAQRRRELASVAPPTTARAAVEAYARAHGLTVDSATPWQVLVSGPAAATAHLFGTSVQAAHVPAAAFGAAAASRTYVRPVSTPQVPPALRSNVAQVIGLDNRPFFHHHGYVTTFPGYKGADFRSAYDAPSASAPAASGASGAGTTVATVQFSDWYRSDLTTYAKQNGITIAPGQVVGIPVNGTRPPDYSGAIEVALDTEAILGTAPRAKQRIYLADNDAASAVAAYQRIAQDAAKGLVDVVSTSWGQCESDAYEHNPIGTAIGQAVAAGATVFAASGDAGSADCYTPDTPRTAPAVDYPASDPQVIGVGGTTLHGSGAGPWTESSWSKPAGKWEGSGGGRSTLFTTPSYQSGAAGQATSQGRRMVPDISSDANPNTGFAGYFAGKVLLGGTSLGAPTQAALLADTLSSIGRTDGLGDIHHLLYSHAPAFRDVVSGSNGAFSAAGGYDMVTGLGSPQWAKLISAIEPTAVRPVRPSGVTVATGYHTVTVHWSGVEGATRYTVAIPGWTKTVSASARSAVFTHLNPATGYRFVVRAGNAYGLSSPTTSPLVHPDRDAIAVRDRSNALSVRTRTSGWHGLGGTLIAPPTVVTYGGTAYYIGVGTDHQLAIRTDTSGWRPLGTNGPACTGVDAMVSGGLLTVACRDTGNHLQVARVHMGSGIPQATKWFGMGGDLKSAVGVAPLGGTTTFFAVGPGYHVYTRTMASGWSAHGWRCANSPAAFRDPASKRTYVACRGLNNALYYATSTGASWSPFRSLGGKVTGRPAILPHGTFLTEGAVTGVTYLRTLTTPWRGYGGKPLGGVAASGE